MPIAFIFLRVQLGSSDRVREALIQIPNVLEVYIVYGNYDIIAKVEAASMGEMKQIVTQTIRRQGNIRATQTLVVMDE